MFKSVQQVIPPDIFFGLFSGLLSLGALWTGGRMELQPSSFLAFYLRLYKQICTPDTCPWLLDLVHQNRELDLLCKEVKGCSRQPALSSRCGTSHLIQRVWTPLLRLHPGEWTCGLWQGVNRTLWHTTLITFDISLKVLFPDQTFTFGTISSSLCFAKTLFEGYSGITDWFMPQMWFISFPSNLKNQEQKPGCLSLWQLRIATTALHSCLFM